MTSKEKKKSIVLIGLNGRGGPLTYSCTVANCLSDKHDVSLVLPSYSDKSMLKEQVRLIELKAPPDALKTMLLTFNILQHIRLIRKINSSHPDMINILDIHPWYVMYWPFLKAKEKIVTINDVQPHSGEAGIITTLMIKFTTAFLLRKADKIITLSEYQTKILKSMGFKREIVTSRLGDQFILSEKNIPKERFRTENDNILFFGRIRDYKGLDYLLDSLISLKKKGIKFRLIIAGEGDIRPYSMKIGSLGKEYVEQHIGYVPDPCMSEYFQRSSFVVLPYTEATQTGVASISYHFRKPMIATMVGGLPEVVIDRKTGIIVPPKDTKALSAAIIRLLKDPALAKKMGAQGNQFLKRELDWNRIVEKTYKEF